MENIKLEAGKHYWTEDGRKAFVAAINVVLPSRDEFRAIGYIPNPDGNGVRPSIWWMDGGATTNPSLVAEWKEPKRIKGWLTITDGYVDANICETREEAIRLSGAEPAACIFIDVLEGQGLDGSAHHG